MQKTETSSEVTPMRLFSTFFRIGLFTIGGGYAMIPLIESEVVDKYRWIDKAGFVDLMAVAQSSPGVFAVNMSIFIGYKLRGLGGSVVAALGTVMPSFIIILAVALLFSHMGENRLVEAVFKGIRPAVVALIAVPTFNVARTAGINRRTVWIPIVSTLLIWLLGVSPVLIIAVAGIGGLLYGKFKKNKS